MGIVHRDLKPANIFKHSKTWKLGDFGFSINCTTEIKTRHNVGTPLYMPLESLLKNIYSPESDIFAVGVIIFEMMTGITPWECKT
jgi:serine/threonine protein kinase